jgi:O-acetylserine/cysteine efflux transporter
VTAGAMTGRDIALAALTSIVWGFGFVAGKVGLESFSAPQLTAVRFLIAGLPVLLVPRPRIPWWSLVLIGMTLFTGQFLLLFFALERGMPPGLASVTQQMQAFCPSPVPSAGPSGTCSSSAHRESPCSPS